ncbi:MAG: type I glyceraldehyde-3-phosphate dehydrogenase [Archangium gephyra]|uniref:Glyceraldehyde-3-phosphate dehydrogenase n=1 Tax=Archangium gephyra TaxID=48 RepID=A0A2W5TQ16_9BACT|nr:MAG: type I glyceraldehyde-3-phosphate dehydrogenase [Archangium gephyra]
MAIKFAINGFGRIGRMVLRAALQRQEKDIEIVAINDLDKPATLAHLFKFDSVHGNWAGKVSATENSITIDGKAYKVTAEKDPAKLPWKELGVDVVIECTGRFTAREKAELHLQAGARKVLISAPGKNVDLTMCFGINHELYDSSKHHIISNASCTTNCLAPVAKVLHETFGIEHGLMTTIHSYTNDQRILDLVHDDLRRARAAALSMIPSSTGAAKAIGEVIPELKGKLNGASIRVPTPNVSLVDLTVRLKKSVTVDDVHAAMKSAAEGKLKGVLQYDTEQTVSIDYNDNPHSSIFDSTQTQLVDGTFLKVFAWYDNEWGYSSRVVDVARFLASK